MAAPAAVDGDVVPPKSESKQKKDKVKAEKREKKRAREVDNEVENATNDSKERKHKKKKSVPEDADGSDPEIKAEKKHKKDKKHRSKEQPPIQEDDETVKEDGEKKKKKKHKHRHRSELGEDGDQEGDPTEGKKDKKKKRKQKENREDDSLPNKSNIQAIDEGSMLNAEAMEVDEPLPIRSSKPKPTKIYQPPDMPANPQFPFFTQTVSFFEPLFPVGWSQPVTSAQQQHLKHLRNRYVPVLRGVLLDYRNVAFGEAADDESVTTVESLRESAAGFGWITAEVDLFVPSRGVWMEGSVNLQTEGHIGVTCFGRFNASIEASRLPPKWKWVPNEANDAAMGAFEEAASVFTADEHGVTRQIHSTGYWTDDEGDKVSGKIRYRIRNFDVGVSGDTSFLSLEGTMLDKQSERRLVQEEAKVVQTRRAKKGGARAGNAASRIEKRRIPDFAMTKFEVGTLGKEEQESGQAEEEKREILRNPDDDVEAAEED